MRASSGTGKSAGPTSGSASVLGAALDGSVSLASCFSEQPLSSAVPMITPMTARRSPPDPRRSRTAGEYAGQEAGGSVTVDSAGAAPGSGERPPEGELAHRRTIRSRGDDAAGRGTHGHGKRREYPFDTSGIEVGADGMRRYTDLPVNLVRLL